MGRYARLAYPNLNYHIIKRGNNRERIFLDQADYTHYLNTIQRYKKKFQFKLFAFCLMNNHVHMLIKTGDEGSISKIMQSITVAHTKYYNFKYKRCGHVWQGRFLSPIVSEDSYAINVMRYIERNPIRAKIVKKIGTYPWSSYKLNVRKKKSELIDRCDNIVFQNLGEEDKTRIESYKEFLHQSNELEQIDAIRKTTRKGGNYLSLDYEEKISKLLPREKKMGRPRKEKVRV